MSDQSNINKEILDSVKKSDEALRLHQIADESFQNATQIHQLEMHKTQKEMGDAITRIETSLGPITEMFKNLKWGQKILIRIGIFIAGLLSFSIGIVELIRLIMGIKK